MKIYFCGSTSVGKSTIASYISQKYNLPLLPEVARTILVEKAISLNSLRTDLDKVAEFQTQVLIKQIEQEKEYDSFVSDRAFDSLAYAANFTQILDKLISRPEVQKYIEDLKKPGNLIFFIRPQKTLLTEDGIREKPIWKNVVGIDHMIKFLIKFFGLRYFQIDTDNQQERVDLIDAVISLAKF